MNLSLKWQGETDTGLSSGKTQGEGCPVRPWRMWPFRADFLWRELGKHKFQLGLISSLSFLPGFRKYPHQQKKNGKGFQRCSRDRGPVNLLGTKMHRVSASLLHLRLAVNNGRTWDCWGHSWSVQYLPRMHPRNQAEWLYLWPQDLGMGQVRGCKLGYQRNSSHSWRHSSFKNSHGFSRLF